MSTALTLIAVNGEPRIDSRIVATELGVETKATHQLVDKYLNKFNEFGSLPFETEVKKRDVGATRENFYLLNEDQTYFLMTLVRNTIQAVELKKRLVQAFAECRQRLAQPTGNGISLLAQAVQAIEAEHTARLDSHDVQISLQGQKVAMLENHVGTLVKAMNRSYRRNWGQANIQQSILDLAPPAVQRERLTINGTHASPQTHLRRAHYRTLADGRRIEVKAHVVGKKNGETLQ